MKLILENEFFDELKKMQQKVLDELKILDRMIQSDIPRLISLINKLPELPVTKIGNSKQKSIDYLYEYMNALDKKRKEKRDELRKIESKILDEIVKKVNGDGRVPKDKQAYRV